MVTRKPLDSRAFSGFSHFAEARYYGRTPRFLLPMQLRSAAQGLSRHFPPPLSRRCQLRPLSPAPDIRDPRSVVASCAPSCVNHKRSWCRRRLNFFRFSFLPGDLHFRAGRPVPGLPPGGESASELREGSKSSRASPTLKSRCEKTGPGPSSQGPDLPSHRRLPKARSLKSRLRSTTLFF